MLLCNYVVTNALHALCNLYHYDCFHICKDLMEGENKHEHEHAHATATTVAIIREVLYKGSITKTSKTKT